jgi:threonine/homoserine efflux transporter RhtA
MAIPLVGTLSAAVIIGEIPHWQDWLAMGFVMMAIASVLWPARRPAPVAGAAQSRHV